MRNFKYIVAFLFLLSNVTSYGQIDSVQLDLKRFSDLEFFKKYCFDETTPSSEDIKLTKLIWSLKQVRSVNESLRLKGLRTVTIIDIRPSKENPYYIIGHYQLLTHSEHLFRMSFYRVDSSFKIIEYQNLEDFIKDRWKRVH